MDSRKVLARRAAAHAAALGAFLTLGVVASAAEPTIMTHIVGANPSTCESSDSHREVIVLRGDFPPLDRHGAALIVAQPGKQPLALAYDPKGTTVPSFSYAPHSLTVLFDGTQWCTVSGSMTFQVALGGHWSNVFSIQVDGDDDD